MVRVRQILPTSIQHAGDSEPGQAEGQHIVATKNRWSRIVLKFQNLAPDVWCELSFRIECHADDIARSAADFAAVGVDFQADDGSSIDFAFVPGLTRAQIDSYSHPIPGPDGHTRDAFSNRLQKTTCNFLVPAPAKQIQITIRSWQNSHPFKVKDIVFAQFVQPNADATPAAELLVASREERNASPDARRNWPILSPEPRWFSYGLVPGHNLFVRGQIVSEGDVTDGVLARVIFRDSDGAELPPPYPETVIAPGIGAFIGIPTHTQARRFTLELAAPPRAKTVDLGFCTWRDALKTELVTPLEVSLGYDLLLESIEDEVSPGTGDFIRNIAQRLRIGQPDSGLGDVLQVIDLWLDSRTAPPPLETLGRIRALQRREADRAQSDILYLGSFPSWPLPSVPTWNEDPFQSRAWRMKYQALTWLLDLAEHAAPSSLKRAAELALSWSRASPWAKPADQLAFHPTVVALRSEALLGLFFRATRSERRPDPELIHSLLGEIIRHGFALVEIIGQNTFSHSTFHLHAAGSLFAIAHMLPRVPLAPYWASLALSKLREGFDDLLGPNGEFFEPSLYRRLELVSLGMILSDEMKDTPESVGLRQHLAPRLKEAARSLIAMTDPGGLLPAFGDTPFRVRHASWIRRLMSEYGRAWVGDKGIRAELSYPQGSKAFAAPSSGLIAARHYEQGRAWGYFCTTLSDQTPSDHGDTTSFVFASGSRRWIGDPGGSVLSENDKACAYLTSPQAHNIAIPNGRTPTTGVAWLKSHSHILGHNVFELCSNVHGPDFIHRRIFIIPENLGALAVFDHFTTSQRSVAFEGFLHFEPETMVGIAGSQLAVGFQAKQKLRIIPLALSGKSNGLEVINGINKASALQGFVFQDQEPLQGANVLRYRFGGGSHVCGGILMALEEASYQTLLATIRSSTLAELILPTLEATETGDS